jgi:transcriptional regulator
MHPNPAFRGTDAAANLAFARDRGFGVLSVAAGSGAPMLSHIPFLIDPDGGHVDLHLVRSNPIARAGATPAPAVMAVSGPDGYISPDWYGVADQVPTWNYVAVHLTGRIEALPPATLPDLLARQSEAFEARLDPKPRWRMDKMTPAARDRLMRMILPFRMHLTAIDGTWKLNQNKDDAARLGAANHVEAFGIGAETALLAALMRGA